MTHGHSYAVARNTARLTR